MRFVLVCIGASILLAATACGGDKWASKPVADQGPCTNDATITAVVGLLRAVLTPVASGTRTPLRSVDDELDCRVRKVLLTVEELGDGWRGVTATDALGTRVLNGGKQNCDVPLSSLRSGIKRQFVRGYDVTPLSGTPIPGEVLEEDALIFESGTAAKYLAALRDNCGDRKAEILDGGPTIGDETFVVSRLVSTSSREVDWYVRRGDAVVLISYVVRSDSIGIVASMDYVRRADAKLIASLERLEAQARVNAISTP